MMIVVFIRELHENENTMEGSPSSPILIFFKVGQKRLKTAWMMDGDDEYFY